MKKNLPLLKKVLCVFYIASGIFLFEFSFQPFAAFSQTLPAEMHFSDDGRMLLLGDLPNTGLYGQSQIKSIYLNFSQPDSWEQMDSIYWTWTKVEIPATMIVDGITYDSVGVRFKGQSTFQQIPNSQKKPFSISMDFIYPDQNLMGYKSLNLNNCYEDESFIREVFYESHIKKHIPAAKTAYVKLYINGENWGLYPNVQQLNKSFYKEWFLSNEGSSWRADRQSGIVTPYGDGTGGLNYLGADTSLYKDEYILKSSAKPNPWEELVTTCNVLNNTSLTDLPSMLPEKLDIDRTLWFLASEILFSDDDSYVRKGRMDYYAYWEKETGRITPQEYDGNTVMNPALQNWSPFHNADSVNYPLMNRLFAISAYRQRYLAHLRTLMKEYFTTTIADSIIDSYKTQIDTIVQNDPKKIYTYVDFQNEITVLKDFITSRRIFLDSNAELAEIAPVISNVAWYINDIPWIQPLAMQTITVRASATCASGIYRMNLFYSTGLVGNFTKVQMYDDGLHDDILAGDGIYGAAIPGQNEGEWVRFYIEAAANNNAKSVSYEPPGAEHNVYVYYVEPLPALDTSISINELMATNYSTAIDSAGEYDDWIELYNKSSESKDISGYALTDNSWNLDKWKFPSGTIISPNGYLIIWADEDSAQGLLHSNFKLSGLGDQLILLDTIGRLIDSVSWNSQTPDMGLARMPNGTGDFVIQLPTFGSNNNYTAVDEFQMEDYRLQISPNPNYGTFTLELLPSSVFHLPSSIKIYNILGELIYEKNLFTGRGEQCGTHFTITIDLATQGPGVYLIQINTEGGLVNRKMVVEE